MIVMSHQIVDIEGEALINCQNGEIMDTCPDVLNMIIIARSRGRDAVIVYNIR